METNNDKSEEENGFEEIETLFFSVSKEEETIYSSEISRSIIQIILQKIIAIIVVRSRIGIHRQQNVASKRKPKVRRKEIVVVRLTFGCRSLVFVVVDDDHRERDYSLGNECHRLA